MQPIRAIIVKSNFSGSNFHLCRLPASRISSRGEKFVNKAPAGRRRRRRRVVPYTPVTSPRSRLVLSRSFSLLPARLVSFFVCSLFFSPLLLFFFPSLSLSFSVSLCVVLSSLQHVHRCLKSSGRQADLRYATARVWARARARERSPREGTENEPTRVGERQRENEEDDARTRRDEERAWDWKENATDD